MTFTMTGSITRTFANRADALRWISTNRQFAGWFRSIEALYMPTHGSDGGYCHYYWEFGFDMRFDEYQALAEIQQRYRRVVHYMRHAAEVAAEWREIERVDYADNSIEVVEQDKYGNKRTRTVKAPSGDICF